MSTFNVLKYEIKVEGGNENFNISLSGYEEQKGLEYIKLKMTSNTEIEPTKLSLVWSTPSIETHSRWNPTIAFNRGIGIDWTREVFKSKATFGAPVCTHLNYKGENQLTIAVSDALNSIEIKTGVSEETANMICIVSFFTAPMQPLKEYEAVIRLDTRHIPYYESLDQVQQWWASMPGYEPAGVPEIARRPMYSTWYNYHQHIDPDSMVEQCRLAKEMGMDAIIVDDGWQTDDNSRGYTYCGDWEVAAAKVPDMRKFVDAVHATGMKFILWYSVPFVGKYSKAYDRFKEKFLDLGERGWWTLDPRFPDVREYLINIYENAVKEWDLDGLKLDFVDSFSKVAEGACDIPGRDYNSVEEAVDRLLKDTLKRLRAIKPDFMIEFRQNYVGPLMRTYGNMFRAADCPNNSLYNRARIVDIRLICGNTAAHADMIMWHNSDTVVSAAMQIINILYSVPQISVLLDKIPEEHQKMLKYLLKFWNDHRDVLLDGKFVALHPEANYSSVIAATPKKMLATAYSSPVIAIPQASFEEIILVNGSYEERLLVETAHEYGNAGFEVRNCCGELVTSGTINLSKGIHSIDVPPAGIIFLKLNA